MTARYVGLLAALLLGFMAGPLGAQSLGDVARQEAARREQLKTTGKVLTNADLPASAVVPPPGAPAPTPASDSALVAAARGESTPAADGAAATPTTDEVQAKAAAAAGVATKDKAALADDEDGWKTRAARINGALASARAQVRQLKALSDRLSLEMQAADKGIAARAEAERADLKAQLLQAEEKLAGATADHEAFQQEARASGVPPAWIQ